MAGDVARARARLHLIVGSTPNGLGWLLVDLENGSSDLWIDEKMLVTSDLWRRIA